MIRSRDARQRAREVLRMVGVREPPVDIDAVAAFLGFTVIPFDFPDSVSGVTFIEGAVKSIGVNKSHATTRQRFSVAHELGHFLCGHESYDDKKVHIEDRLGFLTAYSRQEQEANEFASEILMPEPFLRTDVAKIGLDGTALAKRYLVSEQAMWIQLIDWKLANRYEQP